MPAEPTPRQVYQRSREEFEEWLRDQYGYRFTPVDWRIPRQGDVFVGACGNMRGDVGEVGDGRGFRVWHWERGFAEPTGPRVILSEEKHANEEDGV